MMNTQTRAYRGYVLLSVVEKQRGIGERRRSLLVELYILYLKGKDHPVRPVRMGEGKGGVDLKVIRAHLLHTLPATLPSCMA